MAYDPKEKACTPADRALIKRLAGKRGSETKKRRLRQEKASTPIYLSHSGPVKEASISSTTPPDVGCPRNQHSMAQAWSDVPAAVHSVDGHDYSLPHPTSDNFWAEIAGPSWQTMASGPSGGTLRSWNDADTTPSTSFGRSNNVTPAQSDAGGLGTQCYFSSLQSQFKVPNHPPECNQGQLAQHCAQRAFGSFDSGFQDSDAFGYDLTSGGDDCDPPRTGHSLEPTSRIPNAAEANPARVRPAQTEASVLAAHAHPSPLSHTDVDPLANDIPSDGGTQLVHGSVIGQRNLMTPHSRSSTQMERRPSSQSSPTSANDTSWPSVDGVLVSIAGQHCPLRRDMILTWVQMRWVRYRETQGQLEPGSASACLTVLSKCEEARSLWNLNLSRLSPKLVLCSESPNDVYARARSRLQNMTLGQRLGVEGTLIKLGIAEYIAISLAFEVASLQEHVATRKSLGIWSKAEEIANARLTGLLPGVRGMSAHLWPDEEESQNLRGPS